MTDAIDDRMSAAAARPVLAAPPRFRGQLPFFHYVRTVRENTIASLPAEAFEEDILERRMLGQRIFSVCEPEALKHVLLDNAESYEKGPLLRQLLEPGLGRGLLTSEGAQWRRQRRLMAPVFQHKMLRRFAPQIVEAAQTMADRWRGRAAQEALDVNGEMMRLALVIIARLMFSADYEERAGDVERSVSQYQRLIRPRLMDLVGLPDWVPRFNRWRARRALAELDALVRPLLQRERSGEAEDLLSLLVAARDEETGQGLSPQEIRDQVVTIFLAGHETTAQALSWTWYLLALHPAEEARFHAELDRVLGGRAPRLGDLADLPFTRMVLEEALRLYPPAPTISRRALAADRLLGRDVPKGSVVFVVPWALHRHRKLWAEPDAFVPDRFDRERAAMPHRFAYLPFGAGPRICIGASLAMTEATLVLATIGQRFRLRLVPGHPIEPVGLITLRPRHGIQVTLEPRR